MTFRIVKKRIKDLTADEIESICKQHYMTCGKCSLRRKGGAYCYKIKKDAKSNYQNDPLAEREVTFYKQLTEEEKDDEEKRILIRLYESIRTKTRKPKRRTKKTK